MYSLLLGFCLGVLSLLWWPWTSFPILLAVLLSAAIVALWALYARRYWCLGLALGLGYAQWVILDHRQITDALPIESEYTTIIGVVNTLSVSDNPIKNITFRTISVEDPLFPPNKQPIIRLYNKNGLPLAQGEKWRFRVKWSQPSSELNRAGFDKEAWLVGMGIHGEGVIFSGTLLSSQISWRQKQLDRHWPQMVNLSFSGTLLALGFGDRQGLSDEWRTTLQQSGLAHLLAISGLHISLVFGLSYWVLLRIRGERWIAIQPLALWWIALSMAGLYATLAGWGMSTVRAWGMCAIWLILKTLGMRLSGTQLLLCLFSLCLLAFPLSVFQVGFWLSFFAVAAIFALLWLRDIRMQAWSQWQQAIALQLGLFVLLLPIQWTIFGGVSVFSVLANLLAIPLVSLVSVPCVLLALCFGFSSWLSALFWWLADLSVLPVYALAQFGQMGWLSSNVPAWFWGICGLGMALLFRRYWVMWLSFSGLLTLISLSVPLGWQLRFLDVGHGLATVIERNNRYLLFDTGASWENGSMAERAILPFLSANKGQLDGIILSHDDNDHLGGLPTLLTKYPNVWIRRSQEDKTSLPCVQGESWRWQGLTFRVVWPPKLVKRAYNRHSCTVVISDETFSAVPTRVLLTGDLDALGEILSLRHPWMAKVDIVQVPHHGSLTSSTQTWVDAIAPKIAVATTGRNNPWNLPKSVVKTRYRSNGALWFDTAQFGQVDVSLGLGKHQVNTARLDDNRWFRVQTKCDEFGVTGCRE